MKENIELYPPLAISKIGQRSNNEDAVFPDVGTAQSLDRVFLVCDGVGGANKGEVASALICKHYGAFLKQTIKQNSTITPNLVSRGLVYVEEKFQEALTVSPEYRGMASTLTLICFYENKCIVGWVGDSRIYHIRNGTILFKSKDHSLVNMLIDNGEISEAEAENHPQRNVILRAVNGEESTIIEIETIENIQVDDYFLLCTDGIWESTNDEDLQSLCVSRNIPEQILQTIGQEAKEKSTDNYSIYLLKVRSVNAAKISEVQYSLSRRETPSTKLNLRTLNDKEKWPYLQIGINIVISILLFLCSIFYLIYVCLSVKKKISLVFPILVKIWVLIRHY